VRITFPVDAPPEAWARLADPAVVAACLPGCRSAAVSGDGPGLRVVADVSVASVRGLWAGTVVRVDDDAVRVAGSGEPGKLDLVVRADPARTALTVEGSVDGPLAAVGSAVVAAAVRRLAGDVLAAAAAPAGNPAPAADRDGPPAAPVSGEREVATAPRPWSRRGPMAAAAGAVVVVVLGRRRARRRARR
jgi:uncharacterized protein